MNTSISYITPVYNCSEMIYDAINSIVDCNYKEGDEIVIVNDASTDNTVSIIEKLQKKYDFIKLVHHHYNKGTAGAGRNTGIDNAKNELLFCLDQDNVLIPGSIEKLKSYMISQKANVAAFGEIHFFKEDIANVTHKWVFNDKITLEDALSGFIWPGPSGNFMLTKTAWLKAGRCFEPTLINNTLDSWSFGIRLLGTGAKIVALKD
jgi:glycosyltransferase involved in cell wall biosynthesis